MKWILPLLLVGCATVSSDDLLKEAAACQSSGKDEATCQPLWDAFNKREEIRLKREQQREWENSCREREMVMYCDRRGAGRRKEDCVCVTQEQINRALAGY